MLRLRGRYGTYSNLTHLIVTPQFCLLNWPVSPDRSNIPTVGITHVTQPSEQETKELSRYERGVVGLNPDLRLPTKSARSDGRSHLLGQAPSTAFPVTFSPFSPLCLQSSGWDFGGLFLVLQFSTKHLLIILTPYIRRLDPEVPGLITGHKALGTWWN